MLTRQERLTKALWRYVHDKRHVWSRSTRLTVPSKLKSLIDLGFDPSECFNQLTEKKFSRYTIKVYFQTASNFEREALSKSTFHDFIKKNKKAFANAYKDKTDRLTHAEFASALEAASQWDDKVYNMLILMGEAGLRISEAMRVRWDDFTEDCVLVVRNGKGNKQRKVLLPRHRLRVAKTDGEDDDLICGSVFVRRFFKKHLPTNITPHSFRAYFIMTMSEDYGLSLHEIAGLVGHSSTSVTDRYLRTDFEKLKRTVLVSRPGLTVRRVEMGK